MNQIATGNNSGLMEESGNGTQDTLSFWVEAYFSHAVTTSKTSRQVQARDISLFIRFAEKEGGYPVITNGGGA